MVSAKPEGAGRQYVTYDEPQVVVQFYDGYTGKLAYAESVSTLDAKPGREKPWTERLWVYDLRTNKHFTLKQNRDACTLQMDMDALRRRLDMIKKGQL